MVLECAINASADAIITFNKRDFLPAATQFGIEVLSTNEFIQQLRLGEKLTEILHQLFGFLSGSGSDDDFKPKPSGNVFIVPNLLEHLSPAHSRQQFLQSQASSCFPV